MANQLSALQKQYYAKEVQRQLYYKVSALSLAKMVDMPHGTTYHKPLIEFNTVQEYVKNTDIAVEDIATTDETLVINRTPLVATGIDEVELLEIDYSLLDTVAANAAQVIREDLDGNFFAEVLNASNTNTPVKLTTGASGNTVNVFAQAVASLVNQGVDDSNLVSVSDPFSMALIGESALGRTFAESDLMFRRGFRGNFVGTSMMSSSLLTTTAALAFGTLPTANDTVTVNGVVFTFVSTIGTTPGNVLIEANAAGTLANLVAAINKTTAAGKYVEVSGQNRIRKLAGIVATNNTTSMGLVSKRGYRTLSSALTAGADKWSDIVTNNVIMERGAISLAVQKGINVVTRDKPLQLGTNFFTWMRYGLKTFTEGADRMYRLQIIVQDAEA